MWHDSPDLGSEECEEACLVFPEEEEEEEDEDEDEVQLPQAVADTGMPIVQQLFYTPTSVQAAWDNHFGAFFGAKDLDKIMLDYDELSVIQKYNTKNGTLKTYEGPMQIREQMTRLFSMMTDLSTLKVSVCKVEEVPKNVFLCWECRGSGIEHAVETLLLDEGLKIRRQNIFVTSWWWW